MKKEFKFNRIAVLSTTFLALNAYSYDRDIRVKKTDFFTGRISVTFHIERTLDFNPRTAQMKYPISSEVDRSVRKVLKSYGVSFDQKSEIQIHNESGIIDLSCFNCLIRSLDQRPDNSDQGGY